MNPKESTLKEDMRQNWSQSRYGYYDQFHFRIERGDKYKLYWHEIYITETHTLQAAKIISTVLLNDKIIAG